MADRIRFDVSGLDDVKRKMAQLKADVIHRTGRAALRRAAIVLREQARSNARRIDDHETAEAIWKNIDVRWDARSYRANGTLGFRVGVLGGARKYADTKANRRAGRAGADMAAPGSSGNPGGDTWYWRMKEFGTSKMPAQPILRPVGEQAGQEAVDTFARFFNQGLNRAIKRNTK
ncbi:HK97-gp10 family putative phage morphogenesis protein [Stenotrophomonas sp. NPDC078853]|uniref:HK97-gp10 family putative phage morphogenesis protein n=1 Tax=Stenotrophomonas sp. NPDC078853 TaxID=3364534 RepID=UPI00384D06C2